MRRRDQVSHGISRRQRLLWLPLVLLLYFIAGETEAPRVNSPKNMELGRGRSKTRIPVAGRLFRLSHSGVTIRGTRDAN